jgi:uncharacterized protein HemX
MEENNTELNKKTQEPHDPIKKEDGAVGPIIGSIIIIVLIVLGGYYYWDSIKNENVSNNQNQGLPDNVAKDLSDIEKDLELPELDQIEQEISEIEQEIEEELN